MAPQKMKQWVTAQDGLDKLRMQDVDMPAPGENEVLVEIHTVSLNYRDTEVAMGLYNHHKSVDHPPTLVPCSDMCGIVIAVGPSKLKENDPYTSSNFQLKEGDRVLSTFAPKHLTGQINASMLASGLGGPEPGVLAQYRIFPTFAVLPCPSYLSDAEACTLPIAAVTAWMSLNSLRPRSEIVNQPPPEGLEKETVLCQGTGGVSIAGLQIAKAAGARVIITSSSDSKLDKAKTLGADSTINYKSTPDWEIEVLKQTSDHGADVIFELGGAQTLRKSFDCVAFGGLIACIGYLSGKQDEAGDRTNTNLLALKRNVTLKGILNGPRDRFAEMLEFYAEHEIHPIVDKTFAFADAKEAFQYLFSGEHFGKVVIAMK